MPESLDQGQQGGGGCNGEHVEGGEEQRKNIAMMYISNECFDSPDIQLFKSQNLKRFENPEIN